MKLYKKLIISFFLIFVLGAISVARAEDQALPQIKILSFNTGPNRRTIEERYQEALIIATFIKNKHIEIVGLQERDYATQIDNDEVLFRRAFVEINYPMYIQQVQEDEHEANIIISKYPFIEGSYAEHLVGGNRNRIVQRIAVQTPYQARLWVVNLHTNAARPNPTCDQAGEILYNTRNSSRPFSVPADEPTVVMGDFNVWMYHNGEIGGCHWQSSVISEITHFVVSCVQSNRCYQLNNGIDDNGKTRNIDWIITTKSSGTSIQETWVDTTIKYVGDGHPPLMGIITHPSLKQSAPLLKGDLNNDYKVDIFDYNILLGVFGKSGTVGFHPADIDDNGKIDIFDYNTLLANLGK